MIDTWMRKDRLTREAKCDVLTTHFGSSLLQRLGPKGANEIAQGMWQLVFLHLQLMKLKKELKCQHQRLLALDYIIKVIESECKFYLYRNDRHLYRNHSLNLKLGHSLHKCT